MAVHVYCCDKEDSEVDMPVCVQNYTRFAVTRHTVYTVHACTSVQKHNALTEESHISCYMEYASINYSQNNDFN